MARIKIYFFSWNTFYSRAIKYVTGEKITHCGIGYLEDGKHTVYEAINKGFVKSQYTDAFIQESTHIKVINVESKITKTEFQAICDGYLGKGYDWISIFNIMYFYITSKTAKTLINLKGSRLLICSEAVARILKGAGVIDLSKKLNKPFDYIRPQEIYNTLKNGRY